MAQITTSPQTWLVTGCSSGFGELPVRQLRALGDNVIATRRNAETKLAHLKDTGADILDLDVSVPEAEQDLETWFKANFHGPLNITRALLPKLRAKGTGSLVYRSSQAAWHTDPSATSYCSPRAVECLSKELAIFAPGIKVLIVEPGYFGTRAFSNISHVAPSVDAFAQFNTGVRAYEEGLVVTLPRRSSA
ncbi:hypothetical protein VM1G_06300 [Cytospora mali]|uniref:NADPH-dependent 1-acyldihydroxyacetone phosphate reductase n=1 Tax=Cytospora mali TaxID=578113 RepID=A0A194W158_CYTMA|nr:hypothetical protein VM1G_06300 [Valsa mali]